MKWSYIFWIVFALSVDAYSRVNAMVNVITVGQTQTGRFSGTGVNPSNKPRTLQDNIVDATIYGHSIASIIWDNLDNQVQILPLQMNLITSHEKLLERDAKIDALLSRKVPQEEPDWSMVMPSFGNFIHVDWYPSDTRQLELNFNKPITMRQAGIAWYHSLQKRKGKGGKRSFR